MSTLSRRPWSQLQRSENLIISQPRPIQQTTPLISDKLVQCVIVAPENPTCAGLAEKLQQHLQTITTTIVPIVTLPSTPFTLFAEDPLAEYGQLPLSAGSNHELDLVARTLATYKGKHFILLGNLSTNPLMASLYRAYLCPVDNSFPGRGGLYLRTLCDPWGDGSNRIVIGASTDVDLARAVERFMELLQCNGNKVSIPYLHETQLSDEFVATYSDTTFYPDMAYCQNVRDCAKKAYATRSHGAMCPYLTQSAMMFQLTGNPTFAQLYLDIFQDMVHEVSHWENDVWGPWGFDADFSSALMVQGWHAISDSPVFTSEDRINMASHLVAYLGNNETHWHSHRPKTVQPTRQNHFTFASLGLLFGALTFGCCYRLAKAKSWLAMADECFTPQLEALKGTEDCESYGWLTFTHALRYALLRPALDYFTSGMCRKMLEQGVSTMDNLGYQVPYGDAASWSGSFSEVAYWRPAAWVLNDPTFHAILVKKEQAQEKANPKNRSFTSYRFDLPPAAAKESLTAPAKLQVLPIEPAYYETHREGTLSISAGFDKIAFRTGLTNHQPYLLLDGMNNGSHGHRDANAIVRFTSRDRIWLEDADYDKVAANFHNTLLLSCNGEAVVWPAYARLDTVLEGSRIAFSASTLLAEGFAHWTRSLFCVPNLGFIVVDQVTAQKTGEFNITAMWRTVGETALQGNRWTISMGEEKLHLLGTTPTNNRLYFSELNEEYKRTNWRSYPYAGACVKILRQTQRVEMAAGDTAVLVNIIIDSDSTASMRTMVPGWLQGIVGSKRFLLGWTGCENNHSATSSQTSAKLIYVDNDDLVATDLAPMPSWQHTVPAAIWERTNKQLIMAKHDMPTSVTDEYKAVLLSLDQVLDQNINNAPSQVSLNSTTCVNKPAPQTVEYRTVGAVVAAWQVGNHTVSAIATADIDGDGCDEVIIGTDTGWLYTYKTDQLLWERKTHAAVTALGCADLSGSGFPSILAGEAQGTLEVYASDGSMHWRQEFAPHMGHPATVRAAFAGRLVANQPLAVLIATESCHVHAFSHDGAALWRYEVVHAASAACAADIDGDGCDEVVAGTEYWTWHCIKPTGTALFKTRGVEGSGCATVCTCLLPPIGGSPQQRLALFGGWDGHLVAHNSAGKRVWDVPLGDIVTAICPVPGNESCADDILVTARSGYVYLYGCDGWQKWYHSLAGTIYSALWLPHAKVGALALDNQVVWVDVAGNLLGATDCGENIQRMALWRAGDEEGVIVQGHSSLKLVQL